MQIWLSVSYPCLFGVYDEHFNLSYQDFSLNGQKKSIIHLKQDLDALESEMAHKNHQKMFKIHFCYTENAHMTTKKSEFN